MTRRVLKPQPRWIDSKHTGGHWHLDGYETRKGIKDIVYGGPFNPIEYAREDACGWFAGSGCPYGFTGDRLWVRETWTTSSRIWDGDKADAFMVPAITNPSMIIYRATSEASTRLGIRWRPSIHMPRWASRITLEVTDVRVERLQEITEEDAKAEGARVPEIMYPYTSHEAYSYRENFHLIWQSIHGPGAWELNPWVWVIEFKRMEGKSR